MRKRARRAHKWIARPGFRWSDVVGRFALYHSYQLHCWRVSQRGIVRLLLHWPLACIRQALALRFGANALSVGTVDSGHTAEDVTIALFVRLSISRRCMELVRRV